MSRSSSPADPLWQESLQALKAQDTRRARLLLAQAVNLDPRHRFAWLSLAQACEHPGEKLYCLRQAGVLNPGDGRIREAYLKLKERFPDAQEQHPSELGAEIRPLKKPAPQAASPSAPESGRAPSSGASPILKRLKQTAPPPADAKRATASLPPIRPTRDETPPAPRATQPESDGLAAWITDEPAGSFENLDDPFADLDAPEFAAPPPAPRRSTASLRALNPQRAQEQANQLYQQGDEAGALDLYRHVLELDPAHAEALAQAVRLLTRQQMLESALDLTERSIAAGNQDSGAFVTLAELRLLLMRKSDAWQALADLRALPRPNPVHLLRAADLYWEYGQHREAMKTLHETEKRYPKHQPTLVKLAEAYKMLLDKDRAQHYYQRAVDLGTNSEAGKAAEEFLTEVAPYIPRYVQTHMLYSLREVLSIVLVFFLLAMLDAGLSIVGIEAQGWLGVGLSLIGGYLLVTGTSSPSQGIFAPFFGDRGSGEDAPLPTLPHEVRIALGVVGGLFLALALTLVLRHSLANAGATLYALGQGYVPDFVLDICNQLPPICNPY